MGVSFQLKTYRLADLKRAMRELGLYGPYLSEMRKSEVYDWISRYLTDDEVLRLIDELKLAAGAEV